MSRAVRSLALAAAVLVVAGCGLLEPSIREARPTTLAGTAWQAVSVAGLVPVAGREPTLAFEATQLSGSTGCNSYGATYRYEAGGITFTKMFTTDVACPGAVGQVEAKFGVALLGARQVSLDERGRLLLDGTGGRIVLEVAAQGIRTGG